MPVFDSTFYNNGGDVGGYDNYSDVSYFHENAEQLASKFIEKATAGGVNLAGKKVLVVGCAYGYLVQYLIASGVNAFGMDSSTYAVSRVPEAITGKVILGDVRLETDFIRAKTLAGLTKPNDKFDLIIDEDMIVCLSDAEAIVFRTLALKYGNAVYHLLEDASHLLQWYNYKTIAGWKALLGTSPKEKWFSRFYWSES